MTTCTLCARGSHLSCRSEACECDVCRPGGGSMSGLAKDLGEA